MENIITVLFNVESEAYQAFSELRAKPAGDSYVVAEAALLKKDGGQIRIVESADTGIRTTDDMANGMLIGSIAGILAGPLGVLLGASYGALVGATVDVLDATDDASLIEQVAGKLYNGEIGIVALVQEEDDAELDKVFANFDCEIIRHDAATVEDEVAAARDAEAEAARISREQVRAAKKADRHAKIEGYRADIKAKFASIKEKHADRRAELKDNLDELIYGQPYDNGEGIVVEELEDKHLEEVSGGKVTVDGTLSAEVIAKLDAYITDCKTKHMSLSAALNGLSTLGLSAGQLVLASEYVSRAWLTITI